MNCKQAKQGYRFFSSFCQKKSLKVDLTKTLFASFYKVHYHYRIMFTAPRDNIFLNFELIAPPERLVIIIFLVHSISFNPLSTMTRDTLLSQISEDMYTYVCIGIFWETPRLRQSIIYLKIQLEKLFVTAPKHQKKV